MGVEVCTVFAPRLDHPYWRDDYLALIKAQRASALLFGHSHVVVTDTDLGPGLDTLRAELPHDLMPAMIAGVLARLAQPVNDHICFVDADCLVNHSLYKAFNRADFDLGLTYRDHPTAPINNGAMYMKQMGHAGALMFFRHALSLCEKHWGGDQEAISRAAAPVIHLETNAPRSGAVVRFLSPKLFAAVPKARGLRHGSFIVHFKGATKDWMLDYARAFQGYQALDTAREQETENRAG